MSKSIDHLVKLAKEIRMSEPQKLQQRVSFAYGTAYIENENVTREMVEKAALAEREKGSH